MNAAPPSIDHLACLNVLQTEQYKKKSSAAVTGAQPPNKVDAIRKLLRRVPKGTGAKEPPMVSTLRTYEHAEVYALVALANSGPEFWTSKQKFRYSFFCLLRLSDCRCHGCGALAEAYPLMCPVRMPTNGKWQGRGIFAHWDCVYRYGETTHNLFGNITAGLCTVMAEDIYGLTAAEIIAARGKTNLHAPRPGPYTLQLVPAHFLVQAGFSTEDIPNDTVLDSHLVC